MKFGGNSNAGGVFGKPLTQEGICVVKTLVDYLANPEGRFALKVIKQ